MARAREVADLLFDTAERTESGRYVWWEERTSGAFEPSGTDLYGGWLGVSLLFARVGVMCRLPIWRERARMIYEAAINEEDGWRFHDLKGEGILAGTGGLELFARLIEPTALFRPPPIDRTAGPTDRDSPAEFGDLVVGPLSDIFASCVLGAAERRHHPLVATLLDAAAKSAPDKPGVAHGRSGFVLTALALRSKWDRSQTSLAREILTCEYTDAAGPPFSWCNGASGICYVESILAAVSGEKGIREDCIGRALEISEELEASLCRSSSDWSLCHGLMGGVSTISTVASVLNSRLLRQRLEAVLEQLADVVAARDAFTIGYTGVERSTLMTGVAGVALALCHVADGTRPANPLLGLPFGVQNRFRSRDQADQASTLAADG